MRASYAVLVAAIVGAACGAPAPEQSATEGPARHPITGVVVGQPEDGSLTLAHDAIAHYMPAMVMDLSADDTLPPLTDGDRLRATLVVSADRSYLTDVIVTRPAGAAPSQPAEPLSFAAAALGTVIPDVALTNQNKETLRMRDLAGQVAVVQFIYTRCPLPDFCPRLLAQFDELRRTIRSDEELRTRVRLLSVTLDPDHDTPDVLRAYGARLIAGEDRFAHWDLATGDDEALEALAAFVGVAYRSRDGVVEHSLEMIIVGTDGRLVRRFRSGAWDHDEALAIVTREARRTRPS